MAPKRKNKRKAAVEADQPETKRSSVKDEENHDDEVPAPSRRSKRARKAVNYKEPTESLAGLKAPALEDEASEEAFAEEEEGEEGAKMCCGAFRCTFAKIIHASLQEVSP
eukprot:scaffold442_cov268-Pinguiococcus_pyrenoidosus.AAC.7